MAVRSTVQLARHRDDLPLRVLVPGLWCLTFAASWFPHEVFDPIEAFIGEQLMTNISNVFNSAMAYCFAAFFVLARPDLAESVRRRIALRELGVLLAGTVFLFVLWLAAPAGSWGYVPETYAEYRANIPRLLYGLTFDLMNVGFWLLGVWRGLRLMRLVRQVWARWGLGLMIGGAAAFGLGVFGIATLIDALHPLWAGAPRRFSTLGKIYITALYAGQSAMALGLAVPAVAAVVGSLGSWYDRMLQKRYRRCLVPLRLLLLQTFPYIALPHRGEDGVEILESGTLDPGFTRVINEVADGLAWLAPYYRAGGLAETKTGVADPTEAALVVHRALRAKAHEGEETDPDAEGARSMPPFPRLIPEFDRWRDIALWLCDLAEELLVLPDQPATDQQLTR
ncbi:DUF6545 domain-containing protein [Pseudonocardia spinosispora]|uniref:DUF6545 domain-containing protein n=1 Tax=Pseudonocardia spinosispora TaxID=103441 RepID=UPI0012EBA92D|nr:DUF6545 domain-containing protein [Pseudonocardia spinosispora]